jgi:hypothetical protein
LSTEETEHSREKTPNSKTQIPNKLQTPISQIPIGAGYRGSWNLGPWNLFGFWALGFGIHAFRPVFPDPAPRYARGLSFVRFAID